MLQGPADGLSGGGIPESWAVRSRLPGEDGPVVRAECHRHHLAENLGAGRQPDQWRRPRAVPYCPVLAVEERSCPSRLNGPAVHHVSMPQRRAHGPAAGGVAEEACCTVAVPGKEGLAFGAERHGSHRGRGRRGVGPMWPAGGSVPEPYRLVFRAGQEGSCRRDGTPPRQRLPVAPWGSPTGGRPVAASRGPRVSGLDRQVRNHLTVRWLNARSEQTSCEWHQGMSRRVVRWRRPTAAGALSRGEERMVRRSGLEDDVLHGIAMEEEPLRKDNVATRARQVTRPHADPPRRRKVAIRGDSDGPEHADADLLLPKAASPRSDGRASRRLDSAARTGAWRAHSAERRFPPRGRPASRAIRCVRLVLPPGVDRSRPATATSKHRAASREHARRAPGSAGTTAPAARPGEVHRAGSDGLPRTAASPPPAPPPWRTPRSRAVALETIVSRSHGTPGAAFRSRSGSWGTAPAPSPRAGRSPANPSPRRSSYKSQPQAVNIRPGVTLPQEPFRRHVPHRPRMSPVCVRSSASAALASPKSAAQTFPMVVQQQVRRFDIAVQDALAIGVLQRLRDPDADAGDREIKLAVGTDDAERVGTSPRESRWWEPLESSFDGDALPADGDDAPAAVVRVSTGRACSCRYVLRPPLGECAGDQRWGDLGSSRDPRSGAPRTPAAPAAAASGSAPDFACRSRRRSSSTASSPSPAMNCMTK